MRWTRLPVEHWRVWASGDGGLLQWVSQHCTPLHGFSAAACLQQIQVDTLPANVSGFWLLEPVTVEATFMEGCSCTWLASTVDLSSSCPFPTGVWNKWRQSLCDLAPIIMGLVCGTSHAKRILRKQNQGRHEMLFQLDFFFLSNLSLVFRVIFICEIVHAFPLLTANPGNCQALQVVWGWTYPQKREILNQV